VADLAAPATVSVDSAYRVDARRPSATVTVGWEPVADVESYEVEWTADRDVDAAEWVSAPPAIAPPTRIAGFVPDGLVTARVRSCLGADRSPWTVSAQQQIARDVDPPPIPSAPWTRPTFGGVAITWDGLDADGEPMPPDFYYAGVYLAATPGFATTERTLVDSYLLRGGSTSVQGLQPDTDYYVVLVGYDFALNASYPSSVATVRPGVLTIADLPDQIITGDKIVDATLRNSSLAIAASGLVPNGNFEETARGVDPPQPARWSAEPDSLAAALDVVTPLNGSQSLRLSVAEGQGSAYVSAVFPVTADELLYVGAALRSSRRAVRDTIRLSIITGATEEMVATRAGPQQIETVVYRGTGGPVQSLVEGQTHVPAGHRFAAIRLSAGADGTASPFSVWWDSVDVRRVGGAAMLAPGAVEEATLAPGAVTDRAVADVAVDKLRDGTLTADVTLASRITAGGLELGPNGLTARNQAGARTTYLDPDGGGRFVGESSTDMDLPRVTTGSAITTPDPDPAPGLLIEGRVDPVPRTQPAISVRRSDGALCVHSYQDGDTSPFARVEMTPTTIQLRTLLSANDSLIELASDRVNVNGWHLWPARITLGALAAGTVYTGRLSYGGTAGTFERVAPSMLIVTVEATGPVTSFAYGDYLGNNLDFWYRLETSAAVTAALCCLVAYGS
jgi:hypothetical protein